jgi:hypothetical protein
MLTRLSFLAASGAARLVRSALITFSFRFLFSVDILPKPVAC